MIKQRDIDITVTIYEGDWRKFQAEIHNATFEHEEGTITKDEMMERLVDAIQKFEDHLCYNDLTKN